MKNFITKFITTIFSIKEYDKIHFMVRILGIKIKFQKPSIVIKRRKENPFSYYKNNNIDITTIPPATGDFREFQLATLAILLDFDKICKQRINSI